MRTAAWRRCGVVLWLALVGIAAGGRDVLPLADAAKNADWGAVRALLKQGADVSTPQGMARRLFIGPATGMMRKAPIC